MIVDSDDVNAISTLLERTNAELIQLGSGRLNVAAVVLPLGFMHVIFLRTNCAAVLRGTVPEGMDLALRTSPASVPLRLGGRPVGGDPCIFASARSKWAIYLPKNCSAYGFVMPTGVARREARPSVQVCLPAAEHSMALRNCMELLTTPRKQLLGDQDLATGLRLRFQGLLRPLASTLWPHRSAPIRTRIRAQRPAPCGATRLCAYMATHLRMPLTLQQLCDAAGAKARTLEYGFRECYDVGPMAYLRSRRLCRVRRELACTRSRAASIAAVAHRWRFTHMGQFGRHYRLLFGETPSATLARASGGLSPPAREQSRGSRRAPPDHLREI